jgi:hypothetical protein
MKATIAAVLLALCIPAACDAVDLPQTIQTKDGFTISLPADWVAIPKDALDGLTQTAAKLAPKAERQTYDYGFQLPKKKHWIEYPYIFVQVKRTGRVSEAQLESVKRLEQQFKQGVDKAQENYSSLIANVQVAKTIYEPATHILWTQLSMNVKPVGIIKADTASVLTEEGMIVICGYVPAADFDKYAPVFEAVARQTVVADNLKYRPHVTDFLPLSGQMNRSAVFWGVFIGVIFSGLAVTTAVILEARRKHKTGAGERNDSGFSS